MTPRVYLPLPVDFGIGFFDQGTIGLSILLRQSRQGHDPKPSNNSSNTGELAPTKESLDFQRKVRKLRQIQSASPAHKRNHLGGSVTRKPAPRKSSFQGPIASYCESSPQIFPHGVAEGLQL